MATPLLAALLAGTEVELQEGLAADVIEAGLKALDDDLSAEKLAHAATQGTLTTTQASLTEKTNQLVAQEEELTQLRAWKQNQADALNLPPKDDAAQGKLKKTAADEKDTAKAEEIDRLKAEYPGLSTLR